MTIDTASIAPGEQVKILVDQRPVFIRHRTAAEIAAARDLDVGELPHAETDDARLRPRVDGQLDPSILVIVGLCSHFSCIPVAESGDYEGWYCPCHGSHFDTSGRVRKGPAPLNMAVPDYRWTDETTIVFPVPVQAFTDANADAMRCPDEGHA